MSDILVTLGRAGINGIPPEILSEIFLHCLNFASHNLTRPLSGVCRHWHTVVLATPALWASLDILCDIDIVRPPLPVIRTHLQRSRAHPLSFTLYPDDAGYDRRDNPHLLSVLATLADVRQRWENVEIKLRTMTQDIFDLITQGDAPLLRSMTCDVMVYGERLPIPLSMANDCPRLESFQWDCYESLLLLPSGNTQLTTLSLGADVSISECIAILRLSPHLSSVEFRSIRFADAPHFTHLTLRTLTIMGNHSEPLLDALTLPALVDLDLTTGDTEAPSSEWGIPLATFLERSNPPLRNLYLRMMQIPRESAFVRIFANTPHLRVLKMASHTIFPLSAGLIRALHPQPPPATPSCPRLRRLEVAVSRCPEGLCSAMLRARWGADAQANGVACLERVDMEIEDGRHFRDLAEMRELRAEGMLGGIAWDDGFSDPRSQLRRVQVRDC